MAYKGKVEKTVSVKGKSINDIMKLSQNQLEKMSDRDLKRVTSRLVSAANKRIRRLQQKTYSTSALRRIGNKQFSIKGKSREEVLSTFAEASHFLSFKTSKISEFNKALKKLKKVVNVELSPEQIEQLNVIYGVMKDRAKAFVSANYSEVRGAIAELISSDREGRFSEEDIINRAQEIINEMYEEESNNDNFSQFFDVGGN